MRQDVPLGRVAGIQVGANWTVAVILVLIAWLLASSVLPGAAPHLSVAAYWTVGCAAAALFLASLLAHELSHALVARHNGLKVRAITLWMLGGITELEGEPPDSGADLRIAVAGPATSAAAAGVFLGMAQAVRYAGGPAVATAGLVWLAVMNGMLAVFNMLPGAPLDGGRVLWRHYRDRRRAEIAAARAGQFLGAGIIGLSVAELLWDAWGGLWLMLIGWFLVSAADAERRAAMAASALDGVRVADVMTPDPQLAQGWFTVQDFIERVAARSRQDAFPSWTGAAPSSASWSPACSPGFLPPEGRNSAWTGWRSRFRSPTWQHPPTRPLRCWPAARWEARSLRSCWRMDGLPAW